MTSNQIYQKMNTIKMMICDHIVTHAYSHRTHDECTPHAFLVHQVLVRGRSDVYADRGSLPWYTLFVRRVPARVESRKKETWKHGAVLQVYKM